MKKKKKSPAYKAGIKRTLRLFHLMKRFRERVGEEPNSYDLWCMLEEIKNDRSCFLKWTKKYNVGIYKAHFRNRVIIIISNKKAVFTTYGVYRDAKRLSALEEQYRKELDEVSNEETRETEVTSRNTSDTSEEET